MSSNGAADNVVRMAKSSLVEALANERAQMDAHLRQHHQELANNLDMELRRGLGCAPRQEAKLGRPDSDGDSSPSKYSETSRQLAQQMSAQFVGDWPIVAEEDLSRNVAVPEAAKWHVLRGCCSPQKAWVPAGIPPTTPQRVKNNWNRWSPGTPHPSDSAVLQVIAPPVMEETEAEEYYRETLDSLKAPLCANGKQPVVAVVTPLQRYLEQIHFDAVVGVVIVLNMLFIGYSTQYGIQHYKDPSSSFIDAGEWSFLVFFVVELSFRLEMEGFWGFLVGGNCAWNGFDSFCVATSLISQLLSTFGLGTGAMKTTTSLRVLRLFKLVRMLRVLKGAQMMHELRAIMSSIASSCRILFWAMIIMLLIYFTFGLIFMNAVSAVLEEVDEHERDKLLGFYGTVRLSMLTLFMSTTGGMDWSIAANALSQTGEFYYTLFLFYVSVVSFALVNLITGLFVDSAMKAGEKDRMVEMQDSMTEAADFKQAVKQLFMEMVKDEDGLLDRGELEGAIKDDRMKAFMHLVQYDSNEIVTLFRILDKAGGSKGVSFEFFVDSCFRFGQRIKGLDLLLLLDEQEKVRESLSDVARTVKRVEQAARRPSRVD